MSSTRNTSLLSSSEKKRLRDRKAQQTLREKRQNRMLELETRVTFCEKNHGGDAQVKLDPVQDEGESQALDMTKLLDTVERLRLENNRLRERQESLRRMVGSWDSSDEKKDPEPEGQKEEKCGIRSTCGRHSNGNRSVSDLDFRTSSSPAVDNQYQMTTTTAPDSPEAMSMNKTDPVPLFGVSAPTLPSPLYQFPGSICSPQSLPISPHPVIHLPSPPAVSSSVPVWCRVPRNTYETNNTRVYPLISTQWFSHPELIAPCPLKPSPLDLLHGTRKNYLANYIHDSIRLRSLRDVECLAFGNLLYNYSKWRAAPTPATFARLAPFQHPLPIQLEQDHFGGIDMIVWPQMRVNMIRHWGKVDLLEVFDFLSACMKVRWPWNKDMLERDADDNLQLREDFRQIFSSEAGWGLTAEFIDRYPMLLEGMDVEALRNHSNFSLRIEPHNNTWTHIPTTRNPTKGD